MSRRAEDGTWIISITKLAVMNRLGDLGIDGIENRLSRLGDSVSIVSEQVRASYADSDVDPIATGERVGGRIPLSGAPHGYVLVLFPPESANNAAAVMLSSVVDDLHSVDREMAESALSELSGMIASGFLDAWADSFNVQIDIGTASPVAGRAADLVEHTIGVGDDLGLYIAAQIHIPEYGVEAEVYLLPENQTFIDILYRVDRQSLKGAT